MHHRMDPGPELLRLVDHQSGVATCEQAAALGVGRHSLARLVAEGRCQRLGGGPIYFGRGAPPWSALAWGGVLLGGDEARLAGHAAAHLHGLVEEPPGLIAVKVPWAGSRARSGSPWSFERERAGVRLRSRGSPPRTSVEDTVLDLCRQATESWVIGLVTQAVQSRLTTPARLLKRMDARKKLSHRALLLKLLRDVADGAETPLELGYLRQVERPHGLPEGTRQQSNAAGHQRDVRYDRYLTVVELDGRLGHIGMGRFRDMDRDNYSVLTGEVTLRYGHQDVFTDACRVAWQVSRVLAMRGWTGVPTRCANCANVPEYGWH